MLKKNHEELQESHASLRQEIINIRKLGVKDFSQKTLVDEKPEVTALQSLIDQLKKEKLESCRNSDQQIQLLKLKLSHQKSEFSAKVFELEQKLKGFISCLTTRSI